MKSLNIASFDIDEKNEKVDVNQIKEYYENLIEKISKEKFEEGYKKGMIESSDKVKETYEKLIKEKEETLKKKYTEEIEKIRNNYKNKYEEIFKELETKTENFKKEYVSFLQNIIFESLEEILSVLYIKEDNLKFLEEKINQIIEDFEKETPIKIVVNKEIGDYLKNLHIPIETGDVGKENFIIKFDKFFIESNFKEKIESIKNEIKREIKRHF